MNADLERLIALQLRDLEGKRLREELADAPRRVAAAELALRRAEAAVAEAQASLKKEEVLRRSQQSDVRDRRGKIVRLQMQMETATSAAQITALENEIRFAEGAIATLEDGELASMERTETTEAALLTAQTAEAAAAATLTTRRERAAEVSEDNTAALKVVEASRAELRGTTDEALLSQYDRVAKSRGTGVSEGVDQKCSACQMLVRPQRWNDMKDRANADAVYTCESCGRYLYWDPRNDAPVRWKPGDIGAQRA